MQILEELYYGNIRPDVKFYGQDSPFAELIYLREKNWEKLMESLNEQEKETLEKFNDAEAEIDAITRYQKFSYGFRLGVLLMAETFTNSGELMDSHQ